MTATIPSGWRDDLLAVLGFFSRLPVPADRHGRTLANSVWLLPVATLAIVAPAALVLALGAFVGLPERAVALLAVAVLIVTTGALHEDGLADCADGFWGGATPARRLEIMRDSRIGTYGVLALVAAVLLKVELLAAALAQGHWRAVALLAAAAVAGRAVALYPWVGLPNARDGGLAVAAGRPTPGTFRTALLLAVVITAVGTLWISPLGFVAAGAAAAASAKGVASLADAKIGGHTGDVIGAAVVIGDLSYLAVFTMCG